MALTAAKETLEKAKIAEQAERYEDMAENMKKLAEMDHKFNVEERNLLSVAYKNVVGAKRSAWRVLNALETKAESEEKKEFIKDYKKKIEEELVTVCTAVVSLLEKRLLNESDDNDISQAEVENKVFYLKMIGDYYRYLAEMSVTDEFVQKSKEAYEKATKAATDLNKTNPIRLGLALNFSVFHYEIRQNSADATKLAKSAFDEAIAEMDKLEDKSYQDSTLIMQLLRDNLTLWDNDTNEDDGDEDQ